MKTGFITRAAHDFYSLSPYLVDRSGGRWRETNSQRSTFRRHHPRERKFMEKEQLKVCTKTLGLNLQNILCVKPAWHRLTMLEGLDKSRERSWKGSELEGGGEMSHYCPRICLWGPISGLPLTSSTSQQVRNMEGREDLGGHLCVCVCGVITYALNIHNSCITLITADKVVQICSDYANVNNP